jgi:hypothetical protein
MEIFTKNRAKCTVIQSTICNKFSSLMNRCKIARELRENAIFVIFSVPLLQKATKNRFRELSIFVSPVHFYVNSTEFEKSIERSI